MKTITFYIEYNNNNIEKINEIMMNYICFVKIETIEMNYIEVTFICRIEDSLSIKNEMKGIDWARKLALR